MARQNHRRSTPGEDLRMLLHAIPWRLLIIIPILIIAAIPAFTIGVRLGGRVLPGVTIIFYILGGPAAGPPPTPLPPFPRILPQPGSLLYTVQAGDSCDEVLLPHAHVRCRPDLQRRQSKDCTGARCCHRSELPQVAARYGVDPLAAVPSPGLWRCRTQNSSDLPAAGLAHAAGPPCSNTADWC